MVDAWPPHQWDGRAKVIRPPPVAGNTSHRSLSSRRESALLHESWHVVLRLRIRLTETGGAVRRISAGIVVIIGYNGRKDRCWCRLLPDNADLEKLVESTQYLERAQDEYAVAWYSHDGLHPSLSVTIRDSKESVASASMTPHWMGVPMRVLISGLWCRCRISPSEDKDLPRFEGSETFGEQEALLEAFDDHEPLEDHETQFQLTSALGDSNMIV